MRRALTIGRFSLHVRYLSCLLGRGHSSECASGYGGEYGIASPCFDECRRAVQRNCAERIALEQIQHSERCFADTRRIRQHGLEYRLQVAWRAGDDVQHLRSRCLLLPCLGKLARARLKLLLQLARGRLELLFRCGLRFLRPAEMTHAGHPQAEDPADQSIARRVHCCVRPFTRPAPMTRQAFKPSFPACPIIYWRYKPPNLSPWHFSTTARSQPQLGMDRTIVDIAKGTSVSGRSDYRIRQTVRFLRRHEHGRGQAPSFGGVAETFDARNRGAQVQAMDI